MFGLLPNNLYIGHAASEGTGTSDNSHQLSPRIWSQVKTGGMATDHKNSGRFVGDDFMLAPAVSGASTAAQNGYGIYSGTGDAIASSATDTDGVLTLTTAATDNNEVWITSGANTGVLGSIPADSATGKMMAFEARVAVSSVTDCAYFVGLGPTAGAGNNGKADNTGAIADSAHLGFDSETGTPTALDVINMKASGTKEEIITGAHTLTASATTFIKVGFVYNPAFPEAKRIKFYINNIEQSTYATHDHIADTTNFPGGVALAFKAGVKTGAGAAAALSIDWWAFYQADN